MPRLQHQTGNQASAKREEQERPERREHARKSLSGSCAGDNLTATAVKETPRRRPTVVKETPRRQTTGSRLRVALGHDDREPRPPVDTHGPLNDFRARSHQSLVCVSGLTSNWRHRRRTLCNHSNGPTLSPLAGSIEDVICRPGVTILGDLRSRGTSRRRTAFR